MAHALRHLVRALVLLGLCAAAVAQPTAPALRFAVFAAKPPENLSIVLRAGAPAQKLAFSTTARSPRYEYRGAQPLRFTDETGAFVAEATVPPEMRDALLLFLPATEKAHRYKIAVLDDGPAARAAGTLRIINLSDLALSGTVGSESVTLQAGLNPPVAVGPTGKIALLSNQKGKAYPSYTSTVKLGRGERALLLLFPPFYQGSAEVQSRLLIDNPSAPTKSGAPVRK